MVLAEILWVLDFKYFFGKEFVMVAVTCKAWSPLALDVLWITSEVPLSCLLDHLYLLERKDYFLWKLL